MSNEIKMVEIEPGKTFMANSRRYIVSDSFSIGRLAKIEELEEEMNMFSDKKTCHAVMLAAMGKINELNPGDAYALMYNKIEADRRNVKIAPYALRICAVYINREEENLGDITDTSIAEKINDWSEEGLDIRPFLAFAVSVFRELLQSYKLPIQNILAEAKVIASALEESFDIRSLMGDSGQEKV
jgi:hypothetical protein